MPEVDPPPSPAWGVLSRYDRRVDVYVGRDEDFDAAIEELTGDTLTQRYGSLEAQRIRYAINFLRTGYVASILRHTFREEGPRSERLKFRDPPDAGEEWEEWKLFHEGHWAAEIANYLTLELGMSCDTEPPLTRKSYLAAEEHLRECPPCAALYVDMWLEHRDFLQVMLQDDDLYRALNRDRHYQLLEDIRNQDKIGGPEANGDVSW